MRCNCFFFHQCLLPMAQCSAGRNGPGRPWFLEDFFAFVVFWASEEQFFVIHGRNLRAIENILFVMN
ncbi:MAG: hypothetical protein VR64_02685 [Desulfatitalea sp. BRH_c12]|nr:MAG: hypothetical protein VR64_02685 [Desulfatitalea sp. BRH_c12]